METPYPFIRDSLSPRPGPPEETGAPTGAELFGPESSVALVPAGRYRGPSGKRRYAGAELCLRGRDVGRAGDLLLFAAQLPKQSGRSVQGRHDATFDRKGICRADAVLPTIPDPLVAVGHPAGSADSPSGYGDLYGLYTLLPLTADTAVAAVAAAVALIVGYRCLIVRIVGLVTRNEAFLAEHRFMNRIFSAFAYTLLTPLFLVVALVPAEEARAALIGVAAVSAILYLTYLTKSYRFFVKRDVSIMQWILYLCTVEFFPVSFFVLAVLRGR